MVLAVVLDRAVVIGVSRVRWQVSLNFNLRKFMKKFLRLLLTSLSRPLFAGFLGVFFFDLKKYLLPSFGAFQDTKNRGGIGPCKDMPGGLDEASCVLIYREQQ